MPLMPQPAGRRGPPPARKAQPAPQRLPTLEIGDFFPLMAAQDPSGATVPLNDQRFSGRPCAMLAFRGAADVAVAAAFAQAAAPFVAAGGGAFVLAAQSPAQNATLSAEAKLDAAGAPVLSDPQAVAAQLLIGDGDAPYAFATFDMNQRLTASATGADADPAAMIAAIAPWLDGAAKPSATATRQAPVLFIPDVFPRDFCAELIAAFEASDDKFVDGAGGAAVDPMKGDRGANAKSTVKRRSDWPLTPGPLNDRVQSYLTRRVVPEVFKAFGFRAGSYETAKIGCYEAERGGWFRRHRDNVGEGAQRRVFALSLNLNAEDYEGGEVWFPEFGPQKFSPPTGGAAVFSCSMLHEALPVTRGRRFVLVTFLQPPG